MKRSESIIEITKALLAFQKEIEVIAKSETNPFFKSLYAPLPEILRAIKEPLLKNGIVLMQFPYGEHGLETVLMHTSGEWMSETYFMKPSKDDPQGEGSRITYQRRYAIGAILNLNVDVDDDANASSDVSKKEDTRPWLSDQQCKMIVERLEKADYGAECKTADEFVKRAYDNFRVNKKHRELITNANK